MPRLKLPQNLPPRTKHLKAFEAALERLNQFYWIFMGAVAHSNLTAAKHKRLADFFPAHVAEHIDITCSAFQHLVPSTEQLARYTVLSQAITHYEDYLMGVLSDFLVRKWKPSKTYTLKFRPDTLPTHDVAAYLQIQAIESEVRSVIATAYSERSKRIRTLLINYGAADPDKIFNNELLLEAACEARNCIVHTGGVADSRAVAALATQFPGIHEGDQLPLNERMRPAERPLTRCGVHSDPEAWMSEPSVL